MSKILVARAASTLFLRYLCWTKMRMTWMLIH